MYPETPAWALKQSLILSQVRASLTTDAAYAVNDEANRGRLAPGMYGDVTLLSRDVTAGTPDEIRATTVVATIVGGLVAYCADAAVCADTAEPIAGPSGSGGFFRFARRLTRPAPVPAHTR